MKRIPEKTLGEPLAAYVAATYNTLASVVLGVVLGALVYVFLQLRPEWSMTFVCDCAKCVVALSASSLFWHRYAVHNRFAVWHLELWDTIIPVGFAVLQILLVLWVLRSIAFFTLLLTFIAILSALAYWNTTWRFKKRQCYFLFHEHFPKTDKVFRRDLRRAINSFQRFQVHSMLCFVVIFAIISALDYFFDSIGEAVKTWVTVAIAEAIIVAAFYFDLRWWLRHKSGPRVGLYRW